MTNPTATQIVTKPSSAPTLQEMAKRIAANRPLPICHNAPFQHDGELFLLSVYHDLDVTPDHYDCYTSRQKAAWKRNEWYFVGFDVQLARHPDAQDSLWGIEDNGGADYFAQTLIDLCAEVMHRVNGGLSGETA